MLLQTPGLRALDVSHTAVDADALLALAPAWAHLEVSGPGSVDARLSWFLSPLDFSGMCLAHVYVLALQHQ